MKRIIVFISLLLLLSISVSAHGGRTDSSGGHIDSSTGEYHYHHGFPAHQHYDMDGDGDVDCPYEFVDKTEETSGSSTGSGSSSSGGSSSNNGSSNIVTSSNSSDSFSGKHIFLEIILPLFLSLPLLSFFIFILVKIFLWLKNSSDRRELFSKIKFVFAISLIVSFVVFISISEKARSIFFVILSLLFFFIPFVAFIIYMISSSIKEKIEEKRKERLEKAPEVIAKKAEMAKQLRAEYYALLNRSYELTKKIPQIEAYEPPKILYYPHDTYIDENGCPRTKGVSDISKDRYYVLLSAKSHIYHRPDCHRLGYAQTYSYVNIYAAKNDPKLRPCYDCFPQFPPPDWKNYYKAACDVKRKLLKFLRTVAESIPDTYIPAAPSPLLLSDPSSQLTNEPEPRFLMEAANGMMVWIPKSQLASWKESQERIRASQDISDSP